MKVITEKKYVKIIYYFCLLIDISKKTGNTSKISDWISKGLSNDSIESLGASDNSLAPAINDLDTKMQVKFDGRCLKRDRLTFMHNEVVDNYIVYDINVWSNIQWCVFCVRKYFPPPI